MSAFNWSLSDHIQFRISSVYGRPFHWVNSNETSTCIPCRVSSAQSVLNAAAKINMFGTRHLTTFIGDSDIPLSLRFGSSLPFCWLHPSCWCVAFPKNTRGKQWRWENTDDNHPPTLGIVRVEYQPEPRICVAFLSMHLVNEWLFHALWRLQSERRVGCGWFGLVSWDWLLGAEGGAYCIFVSIGCYTNWLRHCGEVCNDEDLKFVRRSRETCFTRYMTIKEINVETAFHLNVDLYKLLQSYRAV